MEQQWAKLLELQRQGIAEVAIHGAVAWVHGALTIRSLGRVTTFGRSLMKPYQIKVFAKDLATAIGPEAKAVALSSHNAELLQLAAAKSMLPKDEAKFLLTPPSHPLSGSTDPKAHQDRWHHPCSGKHAAILMGSKLRGWSQLDYLSANHPYHQAYLAELRTVLGSGWTPAVTASDGCGLPTHTMTLDDMAKLFAALVANRHEDWIWSSMVEFPELIGGHGRLDTAIMQAGKGKVVAKEGADGLLGLAIDHSDYPNGLGIVIKTAHGWDPKMMGYIASRVLKPLGIDYPGPDAPAGQTIIAPNL